MRTVLIGSDFVYNREGTLVPIEINTSLGWTHVSLEGSENSIDLTTLSDFISQNSLTKVVYIGLLEVIASKLRNLAKTSEFTFEHILTSHNLLTVPYVEDDDSTLIIRSSYDTTALVDDLYCKNKINFLNLIKDSSIGSQFAYLDEANLIVNHITTIPDNGIHPNFILKAVNPDYDQTQYPKFFRATTQEELNLVLSNVNSDYFLMEFHLDFNNLYENQIQIFRGLNLLFPPALESISLGGYTTLTSGKLDEDVEYNPETLELLNLYRYRYLSNDADLAAPKLLDEDRVEMADGSFKTAVELQVGDLLRTIDIPNPNNVDLSSEIADFGITYEEFVAGVTYSVNAITAKQKVSRIVEYVKLNFTDNTFWEDTASSFYLVVRNNDVRFVSLFESESEDSIHVGDSVILINTLDEQVVTVLKEVSSISTVNMVFSGWTISVAEEHLFLTQASDNTSYAAIEHNVGANCSAGSPFFCQQSDCAKGEFCTRQTLSTSPCGTTPCKCVNTCYPVPPPK